jgi:hypothetical protein
MRRKRSSTTEVDEPNSTVETYSKVEEPMENQCQREEPMENQCQREEPTEVKDSSAAATTTAPRPTKK